MDPTRRIAVATGVLLIVATVASLLGTAVTPALTGADYLTGLSANANQATAGALLFLIAAFASGSIAVAMYPVLKGLNSGLALGSVVFRTIEAVMYTAGVVILLSLLTLGQEFAASGAAERASLQVVGDALLSVRQHATLASVFAFSLGAFLYYYLFFQTRLVPRWLSGWGIAAIVVAMAACLMALFSDSPVTGYALLMLPIALQEMVLAVWLIFKGFSPAHLPSATAPRARDPGARTSGRPLSSAGGTS